MFSTVRDAGVNVIMISQASSEHSICFAVKASEGDLAVAVLRKRFADSIASGRCAVPAAANMRALLLAAFSSLCPHCLELHQICPYILC